MVGLITPTPGLRSGTLCGTVCALLMANSIFTICSIISLLIFFILFWNVSFLYFYYMTLIFALMVHLVWSSYIIIHSSKEILADELITNKTWTYSWIQKPGCENSWFPAVFYRWWHYHLCEQWDRIDYSTMMYKHTISITSLSNSNSGILITSIQAH